MRTGCSVVKKSLLAEEWNQHPLMAEASFMMVQDEASCHKVKPKKQKTKSSGTV